MYKYILAFTGWWSIFWVVMCGGRYILAGGRCWVVMCGGTYILAGGWWWVVVDIFWLVAGAFGWWWVVAYFSVALRFKSRLEKVAISAGPN